MRSVRDVVMNQGKKFKTLLFFLLECMKDTCLIAQNHLPLPCAGPGAGDRGSRTSGASNADGGPIRAVCWAWQNEGEGACARTGQPVAWNELGPETL